MKKLQVFKIIFLIFVVFLSFGSAIIKTKYIKANQEVFVDSFGFLEGGTIKFYFELNVCF